MTELRPGWQVWRFEQMAINVNERIDDPSKANVEYYVGLEHLDSDSLKIRRWGSPSDVEAQKLLFNKGDIIFGKRRAYQRKLAVADFDGICSAHAMVLRARSNVILPEVLPFFMQSNLFMERAKTISVGSLSPTINWKTLAKEEFALPPLEEQEKIKKLLASLRSTVEAYSEAIHQTELVLQAILFRWFSVIPDVQEKPFLEFGELPYDYRIERIGKLTKCVVPGRTKPKKFLGSIPWVTTPEINSTVISSNEIANHVSREELSSVGGKTVPRGTVLMTCVGDLGITAIASTELSFNQQIHAFLPTDSLISEYFVFALRAQKKQMISRASTTTVPYLNKENCESLFLPIVNLEAQKDISHLLLKLEEDISLMRQRKTELLMMKNQILMQVFNVGEDK